MASSGEPLAPAWAARGTGLPVEGGSEVVVRDWEDLAFDRPERFAADLAAAGVPPEEVAGGLEILRAGHEQASDAVSAFWEAHPLRYIEAPGYLLDQAEQIYDSARSDGLSRLRDWFAGRRLVVDDRRLVDVRLPLFVLAAYPTPGCSATYETTEDTGGQRGWNIEIGGTGMSGGATVTSSVTSALTAGAGQAILVFLPVTVAVEQFRVVARDGATLGSGRRIDASPARELSPVPGGLLLAPEDVPAPGRRVHTYPLAGYPAASPARYGREYREERVSNLRIGVAAAGAGLALTGAVSMRAAVTISYVLMGGRDYPLHDLPDAHGLVWA